MKEQVRITKSEWERIVRDERRITEEKVRLLDLPSQSLKDAFTLMGSVIDSINAMVQKENRPLDPMSVITCLTALAEENLRLRNRLANKATEM